MGELVQMRRGGGEYPREPWLRSKDIAEHFGVSQETIRRWVKYEGMPSVKSHRARFFQVSACDEWLKRQQWRTA